jgi:HlyD family secretion protein
MQRSADHQRGDVAWTSIARASAILSLVFVGIGCRDATSTPNELARRQLAPRLTVSVTPAEPVAINVPVDFVGNLLPRRRTLIVAEVDGVIQSIPASDAKIDVVVDGKHYSESLGVLPGQPVRKDQVLIELDPTDYELSLAMAQSKLAKEQAELQRILAGQRPEEIDRLRATRDEAKSRFDLAVSERDRTKELLQKDAISQSEFDIDATEVETARAILAAAEATLQAAEAGPTPEEIAVARAAVAQTEAEVRMAEEDLSKTTIRAPYDGVVTEVYTEVGGKVSAAAGTQLMELLDLRYLVAEVGVPESYLGKIEMQDRAELTIAGTNEPVPAIVVAINGKVEPDTRNFRVRLAMDNGEGRFKAGQFVQVHFNLSSATASLAVPSTAITFQEGRPHVFIYADEKVHIRPIDVGLEGENYVEVLSGVATGDRVVVSDSALLADGMSVQLRDSTNSVEVRPAVNDGDTL